MKTYQRHIDPSSRHEPELEQASLGQKPPPAFQLTASQSASGPGNKLPGGDGKKGMVPSNDTQAEPGVQNQIRPQMLPEEVVEEIRSKITGMEDLELCADVVIVHSPCYSAEIQAIMNQANAGEIDLKTAEVEILSRLTYLLTNEFKNADGEVNHWAEEKKGGGTVSNHDNMGAEWYRMGEAGGPQYVALTDWNESADPDQGANNYKVFHFDPDAKENGEKNPTYFQPFGNPLTSVNASGFDKGPKANRVGNPIDVSMLEVLISLFGGARTGKPRHNSEKAKDMRGPVKTGGENAGAQHEKEVRDHENQDAREQQLLREKELNTRVSVRITGPTYGRPHYSENNLAYSLSEARKYPEQTFTVRKSFPKYPEKPYFDKGECNAKFAALKANNQN